MKLTPVLVMDELETSIPFWVDRMGFTRTVEVPEGDRLGFVILTHGAAELMLQCTESVRKDEPAFLPRSGSSAANIFIEVDDFADTLQRLDSYPVAMPLRHTFYGTQEIGVRDPAGNVVIFAAPAPNAAK